MGLNPMKAKISKQSPTSASPIRANPAKAAPSKANGLASSARARPAPVRRARAQNGVGESDPILIVPAVTDLGEKDPAATVPASIAPVLNASAGPQQIAAPVSGATMAAARKGDPAAMVARSTAKAVPAPATTARPSIGPGLAEMGPKVCAMGIAGPGRGPGDPLGALQPVPYPPPAPRPG